MLFQIKPEKYRLNNFYIFFDHNFDKKSFLRTMFFVNISQTRFFTQSRSGAQI